MVFQDCHLKLYLTTPDDIQTLILKNCVVLSRANWIPGDFKSLKRFAVQDTGLNWVSLFFKPFSSRIEEYTWLDCEVKVEYDPLDLFAKIAISKRFYSIKQIRVRGEIYSTTVIEFLMNLIRGAFPYLWYAMVHTTLPPGSFQLQEIFDFTKNSGIDGLEQRLQWDEPSMRTKGRVV